MTPEVLIAHNEGVEAVKGLMGNRDLANVIAESCQELTDALINLGDPKFGSTLDQLNYPDIVNVRDQLAYEVGRLSGILDRIGPDGHVRIDDIPLATTEKEI